MLTSICSDSEGNGIQQQRISPKSCVSKTKTEPLFLFNPASARERWRMNFMTLYDKEFASQPRVARPPIAVVDQDQSTNTRFNTRGRSASRLLTIMTDKIVEQPAKEMPEMKNVKLRMTNLHLHANGVFSNVYRGTLLSPGNSPREIAIKKTWPESRDRNFEMIFLTGISRERHKNIVQMIYAFSNKRDDRVSFRERSQLGCFAAVYMYS
ncbi:hypothetical protein Y032_0239g3319 [Ancylostoma ceylanicum]|uniref:Uncharacterized protein n=2 Tax=Ancylostoma ceylanicum TaxID=53326 RepID=A0A016SE01_9BILA|nr:hypothetical protein Y032_0239g3319 [Ancylostoma ceylanicum]